MKKELEYTKSSKNVYEDLGFKNAKEKLMKAKIASKIHDIIESRGLLQRDAASILGVDQPKISALYNGRLSGFTIDRLFRFLYALDQEIEITITDKLEQNPLKACFPSKKSVREINLHVRK